MVVEAVLRGMMRVVWVGMARLLGAAADGRGSAKGWAERGRGRLAGRYVAGSGGGAAD